MFTAYLFKKVLLFNQSEGETKVLSQVNAIVDTECGKTRETTDWKKGREKDRGEAVGYPYRAFSWHQLSGLHRCFEKAYDKSFPTM